jgi:hypothetical protein
MVFLRLWWDQRYRMMGSSNWNTSKNKFNALFMSLRDSLMLKLALIMKKRSLRRLGCVCLQSVKLEKNDIFLWRRRWLHTLGDRIVYIALNPLSSIFKFKLGSQIIVKMTQNSFHYTFIYKQQCINYKVVHTVKLIPIQMSVAVKLRDAEVEIHFKLHQQIQLSGSHSQTLYDTVPWKHLPRSCIPRAKS